MHSIVEEAQIDAEFVLRDPVAVITLIEDQRIILDAEGRHPTGA